MGDAGAAYCGARRSHSFDRRSTAVTCLIRLSAAGGAAGRGADSCCTGRSRWPCRRRAPARGCPRRGVVPVRWADRRRRVAQRDARVTVAQQPSQRRRESFIGGRGSRTSPVSHRLHRRSAGAPDGPSWAAAGEFRRRRDHRRTSSEVPPDRHPVLMLDFGHRSTGLTQSVGSSPRRSANSDASLVQVALRRG